MEEIKSNKRVITGIVKSAKMDKSITVQVTKRLKHPMYGKFMLKSKKFFAHDEENECKEGDKVKIIEHRPISRNKRWSLVEIIERAK